MVTVSIYGMTIRIESALGGLLLLALIGYVLVYWELKLSALKEWKHSVTVLCQHKAGLHGVTERAIKANVTSVNANLLSTFMACEPIYQ